jgi:hypothetical protein
MKMSKTKYGYLRDAIHDAVKYAETESGKSIKEWHEGYLKVKISEKRFRWDLYWMAQQYLYHELRDKICEGLTDDHIDTALRRIVKELLT